ncbi:hypothetical protein MNBD_GAMMA06-1127 [hydrothermal vent metagenome]|uniref:Lipoprotein n=1 Tax=hydrothermal vent metagenome TaxID=652676 RepID=A0A3B0WQ58_9ZZZZ
MKKIIITTFFAASAIALMSGCSSSSSSSGGVDAGPISIITVNGQQHVLTGSHTAACYDSPDGRIDTQTVNGTELTIESSIYAGDDTCSGTVTQTGKIIANISKSDDIQISGWTGQGIGPDFPTPERADKTGALDINETVTTLDLEVTAVIDDTQILGANVSVGIKRKILYLFDDTAGGDAYIMYRGDVEDGVAIASASDPFVSGNVPVAQ